MTKDAPIIRLKVVLDDVKPEIMRRLEVPLTIKLDRLHMVLQAAMGWTNSHLYLFSFCDVEFGTPDADWPDGPSDARKVTLRAILEDTGAKSFKYVYDFGDGWEHSIKIERIEPALPGISYPVLLDVVGDCPPEDCGGPWGYMEALEILADPEHEGYDDMKRWWPEHFLSLKTSRTESQSLLALLHAVRAKKPPDRGLHPKDFKNGARAGIHRQKRCEHRPSD